MARVVVIGPGAVGGVLAAAAADNGHEVSLAVRTPFGALTLRRGPGEEREVAVPVHADPAELAPADWVLVTTKAQDTASAAAALRAATGPGSVVVVAQNGVDQERRVDGLVHPAARVRPAVVRIGAEAVAPGRIVHHGYGRLTLPAGPDAEGLRAVLGGGAGGLEVQGVDDFRTAAWRKLMSNAVANPVTALTLRRNDALLDPAAHDLVAGLAREVAATGAAEGAALGEDDVDALLAHYGTMSPAQGTSMLYDRVGGRPLEVEYLTGAVVAAADRHGVDVPLNRTVLALLRLVRPGREPG